MIIIMFTSIMMHVTVMAVNLVSSSSLIVVYVS